MQARTLILAGAVAAMAVPSAWSQQGATEAETAEREAAAAVAIEARVAQAQAREARAEALAQVAQAEAQVAQAEAQVAQGQAQSETARGEMEAARVQLERAAREVAILTREGAVEGDGFVRFNGGPGTPWVVYSGLGTRAQMGASLIDAEDGALVTGVTPESGAAEAGLEVGDVIRSIDGIDLANASEPPSVEVINRLAAIEPGATVELVVERRGTERNVDVVTEEGATSPFVFTTGDGQQVFLRAERAARNAERAADRAASVAGQAAAASGRGGAVVLSTDGSLQALRSLDTIRLFNLSGAPWGDMELVPITPELGRYFDTTEGLLVVRAPSDETVGLKDGDVIRTIGGRTPTSAEHAIRILGSFEPGEVIEFALMREGRSQPLQYTVEESGFRYFGPDWAITTPVAPAPAAPAAPGARARGPAAAPAPTAPVTPTSP